MTMDNLAEQAFTLSPIPTAILSPSLLVERVSDSFLRLTQSIHEVRHGTDYLLWLNETKLIVEQDVRCISATIELARTSRRVQHAVGRTARVQQLRVVPIVQAETLVCLLVEWTPGTQKDLAEETESTALLTDNPFRALAGAVKDYAIFLLDTKGIVRTWSAGAELIKGYKPHEIIGKHFSTFYSEEDIKAEKPAKELEICLREGRVEDEGWRIRQDGTRFWANVVITAIHVDGFHVGFGKVTRDLTERKAAEARLIAAYEESSKLKSEFLATMSHEIRTPMHGMLSANSLLLETLLTDEQRELCDIIRESGKVLLRIINDILDYSKLAAGRFSLAPSLFNVAETVSSVIRNFQTILRPGVHFEPIVISNLPGLVQGDMLRYRQVLQNLVGNAVKFTEHGSICVSASVSAESDDTCTILTSVRDTGVGVPKSARAALFMPFRQFNKDLARSYQGTGLGLSICRSLVKLMGGEIGYRPKPDDHGSVFWFQVPFQKTNSTATIGTALRPRHDSAIPKSDRALFEAKRLLLAEDNVINQKVMLKMLRSLGFLKIVTAMDGGEVQRCIDTDGHLPDLILMDIDMPVLDGIAATRWIRAKGILTPIIALTANALKEDRDVYLTSGMNDYIPKPVDKELLASTLRKWLIEGDTLVIRSKEPSND